MSSISPNNPVCLITLDLSLASRRFPQHGDWICAGDLQTTRHARKVPNESSRKLVQQRGRALPLLLPTSA